MSLKASQLKDSSIRAAYEKAGKVITKGEVSSIINAALDKKKVSNTEKNDLTKILKKANLDEEAQAEIKKWLNRSIRFLKGEEKEKVAATVRKSKNVSRIMFKDPLNGVHYEMRHYQEIAELISDDDIDVWEYSAINKKDGTKGMYMSNSDNFFIGKGLHGPEGDPGAGEKRESTIIHEATHAIQDKTNVKLWRLDAEAAAHIAQAVMLLSIKADESLLYNEKLKHAAIKTAAKRVLEKKKISAISDKEFKAAAASLLETSNYKNDKNKLNFDSEWYSFFEGLSFALGSASQNGSKKK